MEVRSLSDYGRCAFGSGSAASPTMHVEQQLYWFGEVERQFANLGTFGLDVSDVDGAKPMLNIRGLDHVVLRVADMERARRFYCDVLGCRVEKDQDALGLLQLRAGLSLIDLVDVQGQLGRAGGAAPGAEGHNMDHFCVRVEPYDEQVIRAHLQRHGVHIGEAGLRYGAEGMGPSLYISDPDGNTVELKGPPDASAAGASSS